MKFLYVLSFLLALVGVNGDTYTTENDDFDVDTAVANIDTLKGLVGCLLDTSACNEVIADFKKDTPDAVRTACTKCTQAQKHIFHVFLNALKTKLPNDYEAFKTKYDPEGVHFATLEIAVQNS